MDDTAGDSSPSSEHPPPPSSSQQPILLPSTTQPRLPTVAEEEDSSLIGQPLPPSEQPPPLLSERSPAPPSEQPPPPTSNEPPALIVPPDHVNLRVVYLVTGNPRPPHSLGVLPVNTTVSALREQIQSELPEHPSPQRQRLIYHGRPLLRGDATLREVFRIQAGSTPGPLPYTLHIVIQPQPDGTTTAAAPSPAGPLNQPPSQGTGPMQTVDLDPERLQAHLARIQQQIEANRADLHSVQQRIAVQHNNMGVHVDGPVHFPAMHPGGNLPPHPVAFGLTPQQIAQFRPPAFRGHQTVPNTWTIAPNAATNVTTTIQQTRTGFRTIIRPNGEQRIEAIDSTPTTVSQEPPPSNPSSANAPQTQAGSLPLPNLLGHLPQPFNQNRTSADRSVPSEGTAYVLMTSTGPQGLLFAPGFGWFSSGRGASQQPAVNASTTPPGGTAQTEDVMQQQPLGHVDGANANVNGAIIRPDQRPARPQVAQALQNNAEDNDFFAVLIRRVWLFLRLYLFMFVFSEPGTWKRWAMIFIAIVVCLQPRDGPIVRAVRAARLHLDNLIGPQAPPPQPDAVAPRQGGPAEATNPTPPRPANIRGAVQMTPEEAAARLLRESQERNRGFWRESLYRIEHGMALFLASLIPGVGERHVLAREEERRQAQREEEERRRAEEAAAAAATAATAEPAAGQTSAEHGQNGRVVTETSLEAQAEAKVDRPDGSSSSSSVQIRDAGVEDGELRNRTT